MHEHTHVQERERNKEREGEREGERERGRERGRAPATIPHSTRNAALPQKRKRQTANMWEWGLKMNFRTTTGIPRSARI